MYGQGETAKVYAEVNQGNVYTVQREYDGFIRDTGEFDNYIEAEKWAKEEARNNTASYYAKARVFLKGICIYYLECPPKATGYKGD